MSNNKCMVCHKNFKNFNGLSAHITKSHKEISPQYYYDTYIDTIKIHICPTCGKNTPFLSIGRGYAEHCNQICANKDNDIIKIRHETLSNTYGHPFNRPEVLKKCSETLYKRYGTTNSYQIDYVKAKSHSKEALLKHYNTLKKNNTFKVSKQEDDCYILLQQYFNKVIRNYKSLLYPFRCDFYIPNNDLYIECNFHWTHGHIKYDGRKSFCKKQLLKWQKCAKKSKYFSNAIETWTIRDIDKFKTAKRNKLNYKVFYNIDDFNKWLESFNYLCKN